VASHHCGYRAALPRSVGDLEDDTARVHDDTSVPEDVIPIEFLIPVGMVQRFDSLLS
jgi:hypothetical protein